jgi:PAS domain S-box-containing protein
MTFARTLCEAGGEAGRLIAERDWSATPLGDIAQWPQSLRTALTTILLSPVPIVMLWGEAGVMLYNDAYSVFAGGRHPVLLGSKVREGWPEVAAFNDNVMRVGLAGGTLQYRDQELTLHRHGRPEQVWMDLDYSPVLGEDGRPAGVMAIVMETTARIMADRALTAERDRLTESEARFRNMADHAPVMMWVTDPTGYCVYLNRSWRRFTGQTADEGEGFGWLDATHPDDRSMAEQAFREAVEARAPLRIEYRLRRHDGAYRWCIDAAAPRLSNDGEFLGYVGSVIDIEDRRNAEQSQRESEDRLRALTNTLPAFVWFGAPDGELHYFNDRWYEYSGQTSDQALPNGWVDILHPEDADRVAEAWARARALGTPYETECRYRRRDGAYRWYLARAEPLKAPDGQIAAWVGSSSDIHDHVTAEDQQRLLINELNHRVKNTLATVQALATQSAARGAPVAEFLDVFEGRLQSLSAAHDLLTATHWEGASLADVVDRVTGHWAAEGRLAADGPAVWLTPRQALSIAMALHELSTNALKYGALTAPAGQVTVGWQVSGERLRLHWRERGGPPVRPPERRGFGTRLLERGVGRELGADAMLVFDPDGVRFTLGLPLDARAGGAPRRD